MAVHPGYYLREYIEDIVLTQEEFATELGMATRTFINKETGKSEFTVSELQTIKEILNAKGINVSLDELV